MIEEIKKASDSHLDMSLYVNHRETIEKDGSLISKVTLSPIRELSIHSNKATKDIDFSSISYDADNPSMFEEDEAELSVTILSNVVPILDEERIKSLYVNVYKKITDIGICELVDIIYEKYKEPCKITTITVLEIKHSEGVKYDQVVKDGKYVPNINNIESYGISIYLAVVLKDGKELISIDKILD